MKENEKMFIHIFETGVKELEFLTYPLQVFIRLGTEDIPASLPRDCLQDYMAIFEEKIGQAAKGPLLTSESGILEVKVKKAEPFERHSTVDLYTRNHEYLDPDNFELMEVVRDAKAVLDSHLEELYGSGVAV